MSRVNRAGCLTVALTRSTPRYKWVALSNTTLGMLMATINSSIVIISLPAIFRGIKLDPLAPGNVSYLLWILMGFLLVTAVLVVTVGRLGDMYGRVRIYNGGFVVFTVGLDRARLRPAHRQPRRAVADHLAARPRRRRGDAVRQLGRDPDRCLPGRSARHGARHQPGRRHRRLVHRPAARRAAVRGRLAAGLLRLGAVRPRRHDLVVTSACKELGERHPARIDWWGNLLFAVGLTAVLAAITYGIQPYGGHSQGWTNPWVLTGLIGGAALLGVFCLVETKVAQPMFAMGLFRIRAFWAGNLAGLLASIGRGGLQFMLIIWLQGIWLPLHGYKFEDTPLWAGIYLLPLTVAFLIAGPDLGRAVRPVRRPDLRHRRPGGRRAELPRPAAAADQLQLLAFAGLLALNGIGSGLFSAPEHHRDHEQRAGERARGRLGHAGDVLQRRHVAVDRGVLLADDRRARLHAAQDPAQRLAGPSRAASVATTVANQPPVGSLFAAFLGYNPIQTLVGQDAVTLPASDQATLTGRSFFPQLISQPFHHGLVIVFTVAIAMSLIGALASIFRGARYIHTEPAAGRAVGAATRGRLVPADSHTVATPAPRSPEPAQLDQPLEIGLLTATAVITSFAVNLPGQQSDAVRCRRG